MFYADTQSVSEVARKRIREAREARGLTQAQLADAMAEADVPLSATAISKIESGVQAVGLEQAVAFAFVLDVPFAWLTRSREGERAVRFGGIGLEHREVANWLVWGPPWSRESLSAQTFMLLTRQIQTMMQVVADEPDPAKRKEHVRTVLDLAVKSWRASGIRPGVMARQALRDAMADPERSG